MVIAYEDYPWKNPLRIYWASVTGSRKVSSSQPTLFQQAHDPNLPIELILVHFRPGSDELWITANEKNVQALWKLLWLLNFISSLFFMFQVFRIPNSKVQENYFSKSSKTSKNSKTSNLAKSKWFVVRIDNWNFSVRVHDSNHSHFITLEWNYKHLKSILNSEQFQV